MKRRNLTRLIFVTGTDTGVGKTVLTALLISHLRQTGVPAIALKPFCSGSRADAELLYQLQDRELPLDQINPWFFPEPVAPVVAARKHRKKITLAQVVAHIQSAASSLSKVPGQQALSPASRRSEPLSPVLLIEGAGGLLVPLGEGFTVLDLIARLRCEVLLVSANRLGTINHTLLSHDRLRDSDLRHRVVLMDLSVPDASSGSNPGILKEMLAPEPLFQLPFLRRPPGTTAVALTLHARRLRNKLLKVAASFGVDVKE